MSAKETQVHREKMVKVKDELEVLAGKVGKVAELARLRAKQIEKKLRNGNGVNGEEQGSKPSVRRS